MILCLFSILQLFALDRYASKQDLLHLIWHLEASLQLGHKFMCCDMLNILLDLMLEEEHDHVESHEVHCWDACGLFAHATAAFLLGVLGRIAKTLMVGEQVDPESHQVEDDMNTEDQWSQDDEQAEVTEVVAFLTPDFSLEATTFHHHHLVDDA